MTEDMTHEVTIYFEWGIMTFQTNLDYFGCGHLEDFYKEMFLDIYKMYAVDVSIIELGDEG